MDATIFYYTGTGNSLWVARAMARELGGARLLPIPGYDGEETIDSKIIGVIFPVHIWGVPPPVIRFVETLQGSRPGYLFACAVHAGQVSNTLVQMKRVMAEQGLFLSM
jgi:flavodoxin